MEIVLLSDVYTEGWMRSAGAYKLATELRLAGYSVQVIDFTCRLTEKEASKLFKKFITKETKILGVSDTFLYDDSNYIFGQEWMLPLIEEYKNKYDLKVILGGNRGGPARYTKLAKKVFDILVIGFADKAIIHIANDTIKGKDFNGKLVVNCGEDFVYDDFNTSRTIFSEQDCIFPKEALPIEIARGCKFRCSYCYYPGNGKGKTYKHLKDKSILKEELIYNYENFGTQHYDIMDDLLNDSVEKCEYVHDVFSSLPFKVYFGAYARSDLLISHLHTLPVLEESGCIGMQFGIETLYKKAGSAIGKGMSREKTIEGLYYIKENSNLNLGSGFIIGLPFEPLESIEATMDWLDSEDCPLDNKEVYALSIPSQSGSHFNTSRLMVDPYKWGYTNIDPDDKGHFIWDNGYLNFKQACKIKKEMTNRFKNHNHFNAHQLSRVFNMGFDMETVKSTPAAEFRKKYGSIKAQSKNVLRKKQEYLEMLYAI